MGQDVIEDPDAVRKRSEERFALVAYSFQNLTQVGHLGRNDLGMVGAVDFSIVLCAKEVFGNSELFSKAVRTVSGISSVGVMPNSSCVSRTAACSGVSPFSI